MADDPRIDELLEELLETNGTPEDVCRDNPELLPQVRAAWQRVRLVRTEIGELFPDSIPSAGIRVAPRLRLLPRSGGSPQFLPGLEDNSGH